jgi:hypothetical protein
MIMMIQQQAATLIRAHHDVRADEKKKTRR